jgi:hypothetical protein
MTEREELNAILGGMLFMQYPEMTRDIIANLRIMKEELHAAIIERLGSSISSDEEFLKLMANALIYVACNGKID